ncbi:hypothetical protein [Streptomyces sp. NPDC097619]|uniref:hypothetical protein n=1 Tax=Streptomyces sp. NPDC097619 TaxID=3157228 RepID=UPI00332099EA
MPETTALPLAPMTPHAAISAFSYLRAIQVQDVEAAREFAGAEPRMADLLVDPVERIVAPVTALPGPEAGEPTTEMFALEVLGQVLVATLRTWAQAGPAAAQGITCAVIDFVVRFLTVCLDTWTAVRPWLLRQRGFPLGRPTSPWLSPGSRIALPPPDLGGTVFQPAQRIWANNLDDPAGPTLSGTGYSPPIDLCQVSTVFFSVVVGDPPADMFQGATLVVSLRVQDSCGTVRRRSPSSGRSTCSGSMAACRTTAIAVPLPNGAFRPTSRNMALNWTSAVSRQALTDDHEDVAGDLRQLEAVGVVRGGDGDGAHHAHRVAFTRWAHHRTTPPRSAAPHRTRTGTGTGTGQDARHRAPHQVRFRVGGALSHTPLTRP